jgi:hypothetical protein
MSNKLIESAIEFLSRDTSSKQLNLYEETHYGRDMFDIHQDDAYNHVNSAISAAKKGGLKINHSDYSSGDQKLTSLGGGKAHSKPDMTVHSGADDTHYGYTLHKGAPKVKGVGNPLYKRSLEQLHGEE